MGLFGNTISTSGNNELEGINVNAFIEACICEELCMLPDERKQEFLASPERTAMEEAGIIGQSTLIRLSKSDDLTRRIKLAALQIARERKDILSAKYDKCKAKEKKLEAEILRKYNSQATSLARLGQREYLKNNKLAPMYFRK